MQQQFAPTENAAPPAASYRVTPQEFAQAVSALESRRAAEEQQQAETIPIADAVQHLNLNASESEILSEVEAMRREQARQKQQAAFRKQINKTLRSVALGVVGWFAFLSIIALLVYNMNLRHKLDAVTQPLSTLPMQLLSQVPVNIPVHVDDVSLKSLASGTIMADKVSVDTRRVMADTTSALADAMFNNEWTLVKTKAGLMVRVWATADQALRVSNNEAGAVFSNRPAWLPAANVVPVELPVYRFAGIDAYSFNARGERGNAVNGVLEAVDLSSTDGAVHSIVEDYLNDKQGGTGEPYYRDNWNEACQVKTEESGTRIRLTGTVHDTATQQRQNALANEILHKAGIPATVVNELQIKPAK